MISLKKKTKMPGLVGEGGGGGGGGWVKGNVRVNLVNINCSVILNKASFKIIDKAFFRFRVVI